MNCAKWQKLILLRDSDELSAKKRTALADHLESCEGCRLFAEEYRATSEALESLPAEQPSPATLTRIRALLEREKSHRVVSSVTRRIVFAAAAATLIVVAVWLGRLPEEPPEAGVGQWTAVYSDESEIDDLLAMLDTEVETLGEEVAFSSEELISPELDAVEDALEQMMQLLEET